MDQQWILVNPDKRQWMQTSDTWAKTLVRISGHHQMFTPFLPTPTINIGEAPPRKDGQVRLCSFTFSILRRLPCELLDYVFLSIEDDFGCICLGLTCYFLWEIGRRHVKTRYMEDAPASWVGNRVICAGSTSSIDDEFAESLMEKKEPEWPTRGRQNLFEFSKRHFMPAHLRSEINDGLNQRAVRAAHDIGFGAQDLAALHAVLGPSTKPVIPDIEQVKSLHPRILRNLSRKEYVCQEALNRYLFKYGRFVEGSYRRLGFGHVIWMRTAWSTVDSVGVPQDTVKAHKGRWAGDQFDFVENADFTETEVGDDGLLVPWKDVSEEVVKELRSVFRALNRA